MGDLTIGEMSIIGAFAPTLQSSTWLTLELGTRELEGMRASSPTSTIPPTLVVVCDDRAAELDTSIAHLVENLGAYAILASFDATAEAEALTQTQQRALLLNPNGAITGPISEYYWHLGGEYSALPSSYSPLLESLTEALERRAASSGHPSRIAILHGPGNDAALAAAVFSELATIAGVSKESLLEHDRLRSIALLDDPIEVRESTLDRLIEYAPDLVLAFLGGTFASPPRRERAHVIGLLEQSASPPLYVIGPRRAGDSQLDILARSSQGFRSRSVVVDLAVQGGSDLRAFEARFADTFRNQQEPLEFVGAPAIYDALYYLAYAAAASRTRTAAGLLEGLARVSDPSGPIVRAGVGPDELELVPHLLQSKRPFNLAGVTGSGPFDDMRQLRPASPIVYCWADDGILTPIGGFDEGSQFLSLGVGECASEVLGDAAD